jgi:hypothetical protein
LARSLWTTPFPDDRTASERISNERLTLAAHDAGAPPIAYVEPIAVGDILPDMPIFLKPDFYVPALLEATYQTTWDEFFPAPMKRLLEPPDESTPSR